jgi:thioesterase domain-containing protein
VGPYYLCGWSLGGTIAVEMAGQLERAKQAVGFLALIDTASPPETPPEKETEFTTRTESEWLQHYLGESGISRILENAAGIDQLWNNVVDYLTARPGDFDPEIIKKLIPPGLARLIPGFQRLDIKELIYYLNRIRTLDNARNRYIPAEKPGNEVHFFAADRSSVSAGNRWSDHFKKPLNIHNIRGDHFSIFQVPEVIAFAGIFDRVLHEAVTRISNRSLDNSIDLEYK